MNNGYKITPLETIAQLRERLRAMTTRHDHVDACPECGLVDPDWQRDCRHKDWCPHKPKQESKA